MSIYLKKEGKILLLFPNSYFRSKYRNYSKNHEISARIIFPSRIGKGIVFHDGLSGKHLTISDYT